MNRKQFLEGFIRASNVQALLAPKKDTLILPRTARPYLGFAGWSRIKRLARPSFPSVSSLLMDLRHQSFAPHWDANTRLIILGSLPGAQSLEKQEYYGNKQNSFWKLLENIFGPSFTVLDYPARLDALAVLKVGLWDVIESAARAGSLDTAIKQPKDQNLWSLFDHCPHVEAIAFNGGKASAMGRRILNEKGGELAFLYEGGIQRRVRLIDLPSSSPANTMAFAAKLESWARLAPYAGSD